MKKSLLISGISFLLCKSSMCLMPKKLPNGKIVKFNPNKFSPANDLKHISHGQASLISRNWLQNIVVNIFNKEQNNLLNKDFKSKNIYEYDEIHIVTNINKLEDYIQRSYQEQKNSLGPTKTLFLAWSPVGEHGREEVLFIIVAEIVVQKQEFVIKHLVQSPFWDPIQIDSNELKKALIEQNKLNNCTSINLEYLYDNDLRYKLAWAVWNLTLSHN